MFNQRSPGDVIREALRAQYAHTGYKVNRREFNRMLALAITGGVPTLSMASGAEQGSSGHDTRVPGPTSSNRSGPGTSAPPIGLGNIAMVVYPHFTALDMVGPNAVLAGLPGYQTHLVWKNRDPVLSDTGLMITPTMTFAECPRDLAVLFIGGGTGGTVDLMDDTEVLGFLADRGSRARYVTSVCTGSLVIGAAGLLNGYRATSHWSTLDILPTMGAVPVRERVVEDRNRVTGGGVTAGIDFGLRLAAILTTQQRAELMELMIEYNPQPPFATGSPSMAGPQLTAKANELLDVTLEDARAAARRARSRLRLS